MKHFNLEEFAGGKLSVQLNKALEKVTENIQDPNTDAQKVRKINVSISLRPNDERNFVSTTVETKLSLAPELGATITKGIAGKEDVIVPNPVTLRPYRTFLEVEQPESKFIFRIREGSDGQPMFKLVEADGGLWKYEAVDAIKKYLTENLPGELLKVITIIG